MDAEVALLASRLEKQLSDHAAAVIERTEAVTGLLLGPVAVAEPERPQPYDHSATLTSPRKDKVFGAELLDAARVARAAITTTAESGARSERCSAPLDSLSVGRLDGSLE